MKKFLFILCAYHSVNAKSGMLEIFIAQQKAQIIAPRHSFLKGTSLLVSGALTLHEYRQQKLLKNSRSSLATNLCFAGIGAATFLFLVYKFIGRELKIIIDTKQTLEKLSLHISEWKEIIPHLQQNQILLSEKLAKALSCLETITPLVAKLSNQSATPINPGFIIALQNELEDLKDLVAQLTITQLQSGLQTLENDDSIDQKLKELKEFDERLFGKQ